VRRLPEAVASPNGLGEGNRMGARAAGSGLPKRPRLRKLPPMLRTMKKTTTIAKTPVGALLSAH
jgi:hypothetical protein